jgi:S-adenosylmethionine hydrolase
LGIVTLTTDFGLQDEYVGAMKGAVLARCPGAVLVDICHQIEPQDIRQAAFMLAAVVNQFPTGSVHVVVVDPGVGTGRAIVAVRGAGQTVVAPDNGVLTCWIAAVTPEKAVRVDNPHLHSPVVSPTFHGRDIIAPAAAHLAKGLPMAALGTAMPCRDLYRRADLGVGTTAGGDPEGIVVAVDRFGNLVTNVPGAMVDDPRMRIWVGDREVGRLKTTYADADPGQPLALIGSRGTLEIAVNQGSAAQLLAAGRGDSVVLRRTPR